MHQSIKLRDNPARCCPSSQPACLQEHPTQDRRFFPEHNRGFGSTLPPHGHPAQLPHLLRMLRFPGRRGKITTGDTHLSPCPQALTRATCVLLTMGALSSCSASCEGLLLLVRHSNIFCRVPGTKATPDNVSTVPFIPHIPATRYTGS